MDKARQWMYYFIIGIVSLIALVFLPMIGTSVGLAWAVPDTLIGWIVWITLKLIIAAINVIIFHCFMCQAKVNVKDNEDYKKALEIMALTLEDKEFQPLSPTAWSRRQYGSKGISIFFTTALSTVALSQAILTFDWVTMLTYLFTIILGLIFGVLQMKTAEEYWTVEFYQYAVKRQKEFKENEEKQKQSNTSLTAEEYVTNTIKILEEQSK